MSIEVLKKLIMAFVKRRNTDKMPTQTSNIEALGRIKGYTNRDVGYALQLLKAKKAIKWNSKKMMWETRGY